MKLLAVITCTGKGCSGSFPDAPGAVATGRDEAELRRHLAEILALYFDDAPFPEAVTTEVGDLEPGKSVIWVEPAPMNPVSLEVARAIERTGKSLRALAPEIGMNYAALGRLQDPFYWGHSLSSLRQLADGLGLKVNLTLQEAV